MQTTKTIVSTNTSNSDKDKAFQPKVFKPIIVYQSPVEQPKPSEDQEVLEAAFLLVNLYKAQEVEKSLQETEKTEEDSPKETEKTEEKEHQKKLQRQKKYYETRKNTLHKEGNEIKLQEYIKRREKSRKKELAKKAQLKESNPAKWEIFQARIEESKKKSYEKKKQEKAAQKIQLTPEQLLKKKADQKATKRAWEKKKREEKNNWTPEQKAEKKAAKKAAEKAKMENLQKTNPDQFNKHIEKYKNYQQKYVRNQTSTPKSAEAFRARRNQNTKNHYQNQTPEQKEIRKEKQKLHRTTKGQIIKPQITVADSVMTSQIISQETAKDFALPENVISPKTIPLAPKANERLEIEEVRIDNKKADSLLGKRRQPESSSTLISIPIKARLEGHNQKYLTEKIVLGKVQQTSSYSSAISSNSKSTTASSYTEQTCKDPAEIEGVAKPSFVKMVEMQREEESQNQNLLK